MSEFKLSCEQFLAVARQHFFASDGVASGQQLDDGEDFSACCGETYHLALAAG